LNKCVNTSRNCSNRVATFRISFSLAFPTSRKFFERTLVHVSLARAAEGTEDIKKKARTLISVRIRKWGEFICSSFYLRILQPVRCGIGMERPLGETIGRDCVLSIETEIDAKCKWPAKSVIFFPGARSKNLPNHVR